MLQQQGQIVVDVCALGVTCQTYSVGRLTTNWFPSPSSVIQQLVCTFFKQAKGGNNPFTRQRRSNKLISTNWKCPSCSLLPSPFFLYSLEPHLVWSSGGGSRQHRVRRGDFQRGLEIWKGWWGHGRGALNCRQSLWRGSYSLLMQAIVLAIDCGVYLKLGSQRRCLASGAVVNHMASSVFSSSCRNAVTFAFTR